MTPVIVALAVIAASVALAYRRSVTERAGTVAHAELEALPFVAKDFGTAAGAILCLEDAYRKRDIEAAIAAKDFQTEARLMLQKQFKEHIDAIDDALIIKTADVLAMSFRAQTTANWPAFEGVESFFIKAEPYGDKVVLVTEVCRFPDGALSQEQILVAETAYGWRVLNPVTE